jgi:hypothetical protein
MNPWLDVAKFASSVSTALRPPLVSKLNGTLIACCSAVPGFVTMINCWSAWLSRTISP